MSFSEALNKLKFGFRVRRLNWEDGEYLAAQYPDEDSKMGRPYLYKCKASGRMFPYTVSNSDLFATNWCEFEEAPLLNDKPEKEEEIPPEVKEIFHIVMKLMPQ